MIFDGLFCLIARLCFTMLSKLFGTRINRLTSILSGALSNGNDSLIVQNGSQLDLWSVEGGGYILQKSCKLVDGIFRFDVFPNSNIVCYFDHSYTLIVYDISVCRSLFTKTYDFYNIQGIKTTKDHVLVETHDFTAQLFNWNGSRLKSVVAFSRFFREIRLSRNGVVAYRKGSDEHQTIRFFNTTSRHSIAKRTGFEFGSYRISPDGRYAVLSSEDWGNVAVYDLAANRIVFNGSVELSGSVRKVLLDDDRLYILFSNGYSKITDITIAYIDINASLENLDNRNITFTTIDLDGSDIFPDQIDFRRINSTSCLQAVSKRGQLNLIKLDSDGQTWTPLQ